jgi:glycosyltransferase involved in cell wall biosynthesis
MRILVISWSYPPDTSATGLRWARIAAELVRRGHQVDVVCGGQPNADSFERMQGVNVYRAGGAITTVKIAYRASTHPVGRAAKWVYDRTWKQLFWPDHAVTWYVPARHAATRLYREQSYDAVVSVSFPFTGHLVALKMKRQHSDVCWVMDVLDPLSLAQHTPPNNLKLYRRLNLAAEKRAFVAADHVVFTAKAALEEYSRMIPEARGKYTLMAHVYDVDRIAPASVANHAQPVRLLFAGSLFRSIRNPEFLLRLVQHVRLRSGRAVQLHLLGAMNDCREIVDRYRNILGDRLVVHGAVDPGEVRAHVDAATVLVSIGNTTPYQTPSKIAEYIGSGKPIVHVAPRDDAAIAMLRDHPATLTLIDRGEAEDERQAVEFGSFLDNPPAIDAATVERLVRPFRVDVIADQYEALFRSCTPAARIAG